MSVKLNINKTLNSFDAPNFLKWFIMPFVILLVLGYIIGYTFVYNKCVIYKKKENMTMMKNPDNPLYKIDMTHKTPDDVLRVISEVNKLMPKYGVNLLPKYIRYFRYFSEPRITLINRRGRKTIRSFDDEITQIIRKNLEGDQNNESIDVIILSYSFTYGTEYIKIKYYIQILPKKLHYELSWEYY